MLIVIIFAFVTPYALAQTKLNDALPLSPSINQDSDVTIDATNVESKKNLTSNNPITIDANNQQIDVKNNTITFTGNVVITQEGLVVYADNVVITNLQNRDNQLITAYGKPVRFSKDIPDSLNQKITGNGDILIYNVKNNILELQGKAELFQQDNHIKGDQITYNMNDEKIFALSNKGGRVQSVIIPNQLQEIKK